MQMTTPSDLIPLADRAFWLERRRALLTELRAIERALRLPLTGETRAERERLRFEERRGRSEEGRYGHE